MENDRITKRAYVEECAESHGRGGLIPSRTAKRKEVWMSGKQGEWCMTGVCDESL